MAASPSGQVSPGGRARPSPAPRRSGRGRGGAHRSGRALSCRRAAVRTLLTSEDIRPGSRSPKVTVRPALVLVAFSPESRPTSRTSCRRGRASVTPSPALRPRSEPGLPARVSEGERGRPAAREGGCPRAGGGCRLPEPRGTSASLPRPPLRPWGLGAGLPSGRAGTRTCSRVVTRPRSEVGAPPGKGFKPAGPTETARWVSRPAGGRGMEAQRCQRAHPGHAGEFSPRVPPRRCSGLCSRNRARLFSPCRVLTLWKPEGCTSGLGQCLSDQLRNVLA